MTPARAGVEAVRAEDFARTHSKRIALCTLVDGVVRDSFNEGEYESSGLEGAVEGARYAAERTPETYWHRDVTDIGVMVFAIDSLKSSRVVCSFPVGGVQGQIRRASKKLEAAHLAVADAALEVVESGAHMSVLRDAVKAWKQASQKFAEACREEL